MLLAVIWEFVQNEVLGMQWLNRMIGSLLSLTGLDTESRIGNSIRFFLYDTVKIMVLLGVLILLISYVQSYFPLNAAVKFWAGFTGSEQILSGRCLERLRRFVPVPRFRFLSDSPAQDCRWGLLFPS